MEKTVRTPSRRIVFVVSRDRMDLYEKLREALIREPDVDLILDHREADRRVATSAIDQERRGRQRRERRAVDLEVQEFGWAVVKIAVPVRSNSPAARPPATA